MNELSEFEWWNKGCSDCSANENAQVAEPFQELDDHVSRAGESL
jgi:hypothetical protein